MNQHLTPAQRELVADRELQSRGPDWRPRPELCDALLEFERAEVQRECTHDPCPIEQHTSPVNEELVQIVTSCTSCGRRRNCDAVPQTPPAAPAGLTPVTPPADEAEETA